MTYHIMPTQKINWDKLSSIYYGPYKIMFIKTKIIVKTLNDVIKKMILQTGIKICIKYNVEY